MCYNTINKWERSSPTAMPKPLYKADDFCIAQNRQLFLFEEIKI